MAPPRLTPADQDGIASPKLLPSQACNIILGLTLVGVGTIITALTFQTFSSKNRLFLIGPILASGGVLSLMKAYVNRNKGQRSQGRSARRREFFRSMQAEFPDGSSSAYLTPEATATEELSFGDEPPPYEVVTSAEARYPQTCTVPQQVPCIMRDVDGGITNPALDTSEESTPPPPSYEEVAHLQQTSL